MSTKLFALVVVIFVTGTSYVHDHYMVQERYQCYVELKHDDSLALCGINAEGKIEGWHMFDTLMEKVNETY